MVLRKAIVISLTLFACSVEANNVCSLKAANAEKVVKIKGVPGFFFKVHPDGDKLFFIESEHNTMLDLNTGKELPTVGNIDPVWSPDGKFLTHPGNAVNPENASEKVGLQFYHGNEILASTENGTHKDTKKYNSQLGGVYQSIGAMKDGKYKIISDENGISMADYEYHADGPKQVSDIKKPCSNIPDLGTDLPMISKDGRFLSVYDQSAKSTKIYKVNGRNCNLSLDLGYGTGKVSFNNDSSQVSFHVDQFSDFQEGYFSGVGKDKIKNVVVLNLDEEGDKLVPSSWALASHNMRPGDGGYYPDYDKHGNIYYLEDQDNNFQIVKVPQDALEFRPMEDNLLFGKGHCVSCETATPQKTSTDVLAKMWMDACPATLPLNQYRELVMAIDPVECKKMVEDFWVSSLGVSKDELLKTCPQQPLTTPHQVGEWNANQKLQAEELLKAKCIACHKTPKTYEAEEQLTVMTGPSSFTQEEITVKKKMGPINLATMDSKLASQMLYSIMAKKMPKKEPLSDSDRKDLTDYLQKKLLDMPEVNYSGNEYLMVRRYSEENLEIERQRILAQVPGATPEMQRALIVNIDCVFGQKNCDEYIATKKPTIEYDASKLPERERQKYIDDQVMEIRCSNLFEVTPQQCMDWDAKRPKPAKKK